nr:MAG: hypothetical protein [Bacteriophage sp.]
MKLIDLLVQELPKRGGWPDGAVEAGFLCSNTTLYFIDANGDCPSEWCIEMDSEVEDNDIEIRKDQYESALAASQKPAWNGEGLPPVGMHCEIVDPDGVLMYGQGESGEVIAHVENTAVIRMSYGLGCFEARFLRPPHSEAERKRDAAIEAMQKEADEGDNWIYSEYEIIYDAIAAGKIPGVKLED